MEYIGGIEVVKTFNQGDRSYKKYADAVAENRASKETWFRQTNGYYVVGLSILTATLTGVLPLGSWLFMNGSIEAGTFITCIILALGLVKPLIQALQYTDSLAMVDSTVKEVKALLDLPELSRPDEKASLVDTHVSFEDVTFRYEGAPSGDEEGDGSKRDGTEVLHGVSFDCPKGGMTAIVGPSGSGKSTIARLIASFWEAERGFVRIGGVDVRKMPLSQVMELVSYVSQDNFLFHLPFGRTSVSASRMQRMRRSRMRRERRAAMISSSPFRRDTTRWREMREAIFPEASASASRSRGRS